MDRPRPVLCSLSVALALSGWSSRGRSRGRSTQLTITPQVRRQMAGTREAARLSRRWYSPSRDRGRAYVPPYGGTTVLWQNRSVLATRAQPAELRASAASRGCYNPRRSATRPARVDRVDRDPPALAGCGVVYHRPVRSARLAHDSWQRPAPQANQRLPPPPLGTRASFGRQLR